jgi:hypothetical protein
MGDGNGINRVFRSVELWRNRRESARRFPCVVHEHKLGTWELGKGHSASCSAAVLQSGQGAGLRLRLRRERLEGKEGR